MINEDFLIFYFLISGGLNICLYIIMIKIIIVFKQKTRLIEKIILSTPQFMQLLIDSGEYDDNTSEYD